MTAWEDLVKEAGARFAVAPINTPLTAPSWNEVRAAYVDDMPALAAPIFDEGPVGPEDFDDAYWEAQAGSWRSRWMLGAPDGSWAPVAEKEPLPEKDGVDYVTVYRVEHRRDGGGPYNGSYDVRLSDMAYAHADMSHPNLWNDPGFEDPYAITHEYFFGFDSREALDSWFAGWEGPLAGAGFEVSTYRVPADLVMNGSKQLVFKKAEASLVTRTPLA